MQTKDKTPILNSQTPCNARERLASVYISSQGNPLPDPLRSDPILSRRRTAQVSDTVDKIGIRLSPDLVEDGGGGRWREESGNRGPVDEPAITMPFAESPRPRQPARLEYLYLQHTNPISHMLLETKTPELYLRIEQAVLQLSLGKLTGLGGGGAGGE